jgi:hypothetical protein
MQELAVVCLVGHVVMYDQAAIYIDHALHVVAGCLGRTSIAHRPRVGLAKDQSRPSRSFRMSCRRTSLSLRRPRVSIAVVNASRCLG